MGEQEWQRGSAQTSSPLMVIVRNQLFGQCIPMYPQDLGCPGLVALILIQHFQDIFFLDLKKGLVQ